MTTFVGGTLRGEILGIKIQGNCCDVEEEMFDDDGNDMIWT